MTRPRVDHAATFLWWWGMLAGTSAPRPIPEYQFHPQRRWRADAAFVGAKLLIEIEGGVWSNGRHTRGKGFINDCEKYNAAAVLGWRLLRYPSDRLLNDPQGVIDEVKEALCLKYPIAKPIGSSTKSTKRSINSPSRRAESQKSKSRSSSTISNSSSKRSKEKTHTKGARRHGKSV